MDRLNLAEDTDHYRLLKRISLLSEKTGMEIYAVGGYIRDQLLNRAVKDIDILVIGDGVEFARKLAKFLKVRRVITYERFGTAFIPCDKYKIEVATGRREEYVPSSRKPRVYPSDLITDLSRRDFTINSIAMHLSQERWGELIDPFHGREDLKKGLIKTPSDPYTTFSEDPLRMLRAVRFASQFKFRIEPDTFRAIKQMVERIKIVSQERITEELIKILSTSQPSTGFFLLEEAGLLTLIFPEISDLKGAEDRNGYYHKDIFRHTMQAVDNISLQTKKFNLRFATLVHDIAKPATKAFKEDTGWTFYGHEEVGARMLEPICRRLKLPVKIMKYAQKMTRLHLRPISLAIESVTDSAIRRLIVEAGDDLDDLITLCRADITSKNPLRVKKYMANFDFVVGRIDEVREKDRMRAFQSPVRGDKIMEVCGIEPGPLVGEIKKAIEEAILEGKIQNTYED
ncbi:MAG: CCA tRNA nucleotidyltransferase, partial [Fidelibacterota bacterium]